MIAYEYIPLHRRVAFHRAMSDKRRSWLEKAHRRNPRCHYCKNRTELKDRDYNTRAKHWGEFFATLDHAVPLADGGPDHPTNYRLACSTCNALKSDRSEADFIQELVDEGVRA